MSKRKPVTAGELARTLKMYNREMSHTEIKSALRTNHRRLMRILKALNLPPRPRGFLTPKGRAKRRAIGSKLRGKVRTGRALERIATANRARAKARPGKGYRIASNGYVVITRHGADRGRSMHRVFMERNLGRKLRRDEHVHHVDRNRTNNSLENLQVMTSAEHAALHGELDKWRKKA